MGLYTINKIPTRLFTNKAFIRRRQSFSTIVVVWRFLMIVSQGKLHFVSLHSRALVPLYVVIHGDFIRSYMEKMHFELHTMLYFEPKN